MDDIKLFTISCGLSLPQLSNLNLIYPPNVFGVFISIIREHSLSNWPNEIHGCVGNWSDTVMTPNQITDNICRLSESSIWEDNRRHYHPSILKEPNAKIEISFMILPLKNINKFNSKTEGIIVEYEGKRATYLPNVFPNKSLEEIKKLLKEKAGVKSGKYKKYSTKVIKTNLDLILSKKYISFIVKGFFDFMTKNWEDFVPYSYNNNKITIVKNQNVRNCATLKDMLDWDEFVNKKLLEKIKTTVRYYVPKWRNKNMRQANGFLIIVMAYFNEDTTDICNDLYLQLPDMDYQFELGEVLIGLNEVCPKNKVLEKWRKIMLYRLDKINDIFELNWHSKYLYSLYKRGFIIKNQAKKLYEKIEEFEYNKNNETNYLAVQFEALCSLYGCGMPFSNKIFYLWVLLLQRWKDGLFYFKNNTARIDISGHCLNGLKIIYNKN